MVQSTDSDPDFTDEFCGFLQRCVANVDAAEFLLTLAKSSTRSWEINELRAQLAPDTVVSDADAQRCVDALQQYGLVARDADERFLEVFKFLLFLFAALTSFGCMALLFRGYARSGLRLLLWSALCFIFLTATNVLLFVDNAIAPEMDLRLYRLLASLLGVGCLLYAFIWEAE